MALGFERAVAIGSRIERGDDIESRVKGDEDIMGYLAMACRWRVAVGGRAWVRVSQLSRGDQGMQGAT